MYLLNRKYLQVQKDMAHKKLQLNKQIAKENTIPHMSKQKRIRSQRSHPLLKLFLLTISLQLLANEWQNKASFGGLYASAADCFPKSESKYPKILMKANAHDGDVRIRYTTVIVNSSASSVFAGGAVKDNLAAYTYFIAQKGAMITRLDTAQDTIVWTKTYSKADDNMRGVQALALSPDETELMAYVNNEDDQYEGEERFWMLRVRVVDGMRSQPVTAFYHDDQASTDAFLVKSTGMLWTHSDRVYMAFFENSDQDPPTQMRMGRYDPDAGNFVQHKIHGNNGMLASFAYQASGGDSKGFLFGGAYRKAANNWAPCIVYVTKDLAPNDIYQIEYAGYNRWQSDSDRRLYVNILKIDEVNRWVYGTTQSTYTNGLTGAVHNPGVFRAEQQGSQYPGDRKLLYNSSYSNMDYVVLNGNNLMLVTAISEYDHSTNSLNLVYMSTFDDSADADLFHMKVTFGSASSYAYKIVKDVNEIPSAVFFNSGITETSGARIILEGVAVGYQDTFTGFQTRSASAGESAAAIWSFFPDRSCITPAPANTDYTQVSTSIMSQALIERAQTSSSTPNFVNASFILNQNPSNNDANVYVHNLMNDLLVQDADWCSVYSTPIMTYSQGTFANNGSLCGIQWDGTERTLSFTPPTVTDPSTCTDAWGTIVNYYITFPSFSQYDDLMVSYDPINEQVRVLPRSGGSATGTYSFVLNGHFPNGQIVYFPFTLELRTSVDPCDFETLTENYTGSTSFAYGAALLGQNVSEEILAADFIAGGGCTKRYHTTISPNSLGIIWPRGDGRGAEWNTSDGSYVATHTVTITATIGCSKRVSVSYTVSFGQSCATDTFTISSSRFAATLFTYDLHDPSFATFNWVDTDATSDQNLTTCGSVVWAITGVTPASLSSAFTIDESVKTLDTFSAQQADVQTHTLQIAVSYANYPAMTPSTLNFDIIISNLCETGLTVTNSPNTITVSPTYTIGQSIQTEPAFAAFTITPTYCPVTYHTAPVTPNPSDNTAIQANPTTRVTSIQTDDLAMGITGANTTPATFSIVYYAKSPQGTDNLGSGSIVTVSFTVLNPCVADTPDISAVLNGETLSYTITDPQHTVTVDQSTAVQQITAPPTCPTLEWSLEDNFGNSPDTIFTFDTSVANPLIQVGLTNDFTKAGSYNLKLKAKYTGTVYQNVAELSFTITVVDPCISPSLTLTPPASGTTIEYYYTGSSPTAIFDFLSIQNVPSVCPYTFTCSCSESTDLCIMNNPGVSFSTFTAATGKLEIETVDVPNVVPGDYAVTITGLTGTSNGSAFFQNVVFRLINPCLTAQLTDNTSFVDQTYIIQSGSAPAAQSWNLYPALSSTVAYCGNMILTFSITGGILPLPSTVIIDNLNRQIRIQTTSNVNDHAVHQFQYKIFFEDYQSVFVDSTPTPSFTLTLVDECRTAAITVGASVISDAGTYQFDNASPLQFDMTGVTVLPVSCSPTYACSVTSDPGPNFLNTAFAASCVYPPSETSFVLSSGQFTIDSLEVSYFDMGSYALTIVITAGTPGFEATTSHQVAMVLADPCPGSTLQINHSLNPTYTYNLRDTALQIDYQSIVVSSLTTPANCGAINKVFTELTYPDMSPFTDDAANREFIVNYSQDVNKARVYQIQFEANYVDYPSVASQSFTFQIEIVDPCASPTDLFQSAIQDTDYTITQGIKHHPFPAFTSVPSWCDITYSMLVIPTTLNLLTLDAANLRFKMFEDQTLAETDTVGPYFIQYTVALQGSVGYTSVINSSQTFNIDVKNPCVDPIYNNILTPNPSLLDTEIYYVNTNKKTIIIDQLYTSLQALCGPVAMTLGGNTSPQIVANQVDLEFEIYTSDATLIGFQETVTVDSVLVNYASITGTQIQIPIEFKECLVTDFSAPTLAKQAYELGSIKKSFEGPLFTSQHISACNFLVTYSAQLSNADVSTGSFQLPTVVQFDPISRLFTLEGTTSLAGTYQIDFIGTLNNPTSDAYITKFEVELIDPPPPEQYTISNIVPTPNEQMAQKHLFVKDEETKGSKSAQLIGKLTDLEGDQFSVQMVGQAPQGTSFIFEPQSGQIFLQIDNDRVQEGNFTIRYVVTEQINATSSRDIEYSFSYEIKDLTQKEPPIIDFEAIKWEKEAQNLADPPTFKISNIDIFGNVTLEFSEALIVPKNYTLINQTVFDVQILPQNPAIIDELNFYWETVDFTNLEATFKLHFENPLVVSQESAKDLLEVKVKDPTLLISQVSFKRVQNETRSEYKLPTQVLNFEINQETERIVEGTSTAIVAGASTSFVLNFFLMGSLSLLWGLIHAMQIVAHFPLLNILIPSNAFILYIALYEMANFDLIPTDDAKEFLMKQYYKSIPERDTSEKDDKLEDPHMGDFFDNADPLHNIMPFSAIVAIIASIMAISRFIVWLFSNHKVFLSFYKSLKAKIFWNTILRLFFEEYLVLCITTLLKIKTLSFSGIYQTFSSSFAILTFVIVSIAIPAVWFGLFKNQKYVKTKKFKKKFGSLTLDLDVNNKMALLYQVIFMLRRILMAILIVFLPQQAFFQVQFLVAKCSIIMIYIGQVKPYRKNSLNKLELFNEFMILQNSYFVLLFTDFIIRPIKSSQQDEWVSDSEMKYKLGFVNIGWLAILIGTNFFCMLGIQMSDIFSRAKKFYQKKQQARRQLQSNLIKQKGRQNQYSLKDQIMGNGSKNRWQIQSNSDRNGSTSIQRLPDARKEAALNNRDWNWLNAQGGRGNIGSSLQYPQDDDIFQINDDYIDTDQTTKKPKKNMIARTNFTRKINSKMTKKSIRDSKNVLEKIDECESIYENGQQQSANINTQDALLSNDQYAGEKNGTQLTQEDRNDAPKISLKPMMLQMNANLAPKTSVAFWNQQRKDEIRQQFLLNNPIAMTNQSSANDPLGHDLDLKVKNSPQINPEQEQQIEPEPNSKSQTKENKKDRPVDLFRKAYAEIDKKSSRIPGFLLNPQQITPSKAINNDHSRTQKPTNQLDWTENSFSGNNADQIEGTIRESSDKEFALQGQLRRGVKNRSTQKRLKSISKLAWD